MERCHVCVNKIFQAVAAVFKANNPGEDIKSVELSFSIRGVTFVDVQKKVCSL